MHVTKIAKVRSDDHDIQPARTLRSSSQLLLYQPATKLNFQSKAFVITDHGTRCCLELSVPSYEKYRYHTISPLSRHSLLVKAKRAHCVNKIPCVYCVGGFVCDPFHSITTNIQLFLLINNNNNSDSTHSRTVCHHG